jgi:hypothetical protein
VPPVRRSNPFVKSNWLDSPCLAKSDRSRSDMIDEIEKAVKKDDVIRLMQNGGDRDYAWNFWALFGKRTIEFRKPPASTTPEEVLGWAELAISFIQASVKYESAQNLQKIPATAGGLHWFISLYTEPGVNEPERLQWIWFGKDRNTMLEPIPNPTGYWHYEAGRRRKALMRLRRLASVDERKARKLAEKAKEPYW